MNLTNEALKKAQKQRQNEAAATPATPVEPPPPVVPPQAPPASPAGPEPDPVPVRQMRRQNASAGGMKYAVGGAGFVVLLGLGWWMLSGDKNPGTEVASVPDVAPAIENRSTPLVTEPALSDELPVAVEEVATAVNPPTTNEPPVSVVFEDPNPVAPTEPVAEPTTSPVVSIPVRESEQSQPPARSVPVVATPAAAESVITTAVADKPVVEEPARAEPAVVSVAASPVTSPRPEPVAEQRSAALPPTQLDSVVKEQSSAPPAIRSIDSPPRNSSPATVKILSDEEVGATTVAISSAAQAQPAVVPYLDTAKVTGVRASATDPKVLMNNRVYRLNDIVDSDLQLKITAISSRELQFTDSRGYVYTKAF